MQRLAASELKHYVKYDELHDLVWCWLHHGFFDNRKEFLDYQKTKANKPVKFIINKGNRFVTIKNKRYSVKSVVWALHHGEWPDCRLVNANGDKSNNRIENIIPKKY